MHSRNSEPSQVIIAYVPALHAGYLSFFAKYPKARVLVLGKSYIDVYPRLNRDLRALPPHDIVKALQTLGVDASVLELADSDTFTHDQSFILPDEDVSRDFSEKYLSHTKPLFENIFLRWDGRMPDKQKELSPDRRVSHKKLDKEFMRTAVAESVKSADWWRQIGGVLVKDNTVLFSGHIRYFPSDHALDIFGTPRSNVDFGERPDLYISMHAEADLISQAAAAGVATRGASLYATTFPCMNCAFLIARSGITKLYYNQGYSTIDSEGVLKSAGVEIIYVEMK